jgi:hypothetical protein
MRYATAGEMEVGRWMRRKKSGGREEEEHWWVEM